MSGRDEAAGRIFISHDHEDSPAVTGLAAALKGAGLEVWLDAEDLRPGDDWRAEIRSAIEKDALVFLACFSPAAAGRTRSRQNEELALAIDEMRMRPAGEPWIIPVRLGDCEIPDLDLGGGRTLKSIERADIFGAGTQTGTERLIGAVTRLIERQLSRTSHPDLPYGNRTRRQTTGPHDNLTPASERSRTSARPVIIGENNYGVISTGDNATITQAQGR